MIGLIFAELSSRGHAGTEFVMDPEGWDGRPLEVEGAVALVVLGGLLRRQGGVFPEPVIAAAGGATWPASSNPGSSPPSCGPTRMPGSSASGPGSSTGCSKKHLWVGPAIGKPLTLPPGILEGRPAARRDPAGPAPRHGRARGREEPLSARRDRPRGVAISLPEVPERECRHVDDRSRPP